MMRNFFDEELTSHDVEKQAKRPQVNQNGGKPVAKTALEGRPVGRLRHTSPGNPFPDGVPDLSPEVLNSVVELACESSDSSTLCME